MHLSENGKVELEMVGEGGEWFVKYLNNGAELSMVCSNQNSTMVSVQLTVCTYFLFLAYPCAG